MLEVSHQDKILTFPPWKFNIIGPLALLELMGQRGQVGVLSAIDDEVFWEILSQILANDQFRPRSKFFNKDNIPEIFGHVYKELSSLAIGDGSICPRLLNSEIPCLLEQSLQKILPNFLSFVMSKFDEVPSGREFPAVSLLSSFLK